MSKMAGANKYAVLLVVLAIAFALRCEAGSGRFQARRMARMARRMAMGNMTVPSMTNLTGTPLSAGGINYTIATKGMARSAYPWCRTDRTTAYFMKPTVTAVATTSKYTEYAFMVDENYDACKEVLTRKGKAQDIPFCKTPFYSFMIAVSTECHEAIMSVQTVQMFTKEDVASANTNEMYAHAHKGMDTGVPLLKYSVKPKYLTPSTAPGAKRSFVLTMRINQRPDNKCSDLAALCGGNTCMAALSDEEYDTCPAFYAVMGRMV